MDFFQSIDWMQLLRCFVIGGLICIIGQILIDKTKLTSARILVTLYDGKVPTKRKELEEMPGVGRKTVNVFLGEFYNIPSIAVDTHVERVSKRLGLVKENDSVREVEEKLKRAFKREEWARLHLQLVLFGRYHCKAVAPNCDNCELKDICMYEKRS